ncbi:exodeoxyribonuclease V subunit alpha [Rubrivirga litoralis]|uniref:Exodeoxyribonuclease V subunit alpha n=1 Tax=Rubrivirga litoralis TaxID=3075598 RepID=A0ABU3BPR1_9BACT|nr:exodeoxyribonuclease V subunit alpha [Rubrivirga sp. F394]MDT0631275.1 exodeoxyribonuclease V subunit alpha [Rubrivirga sp. F394]
MRRLPHAVADALDRLAEAEAAAPIDLALGRMVAGLDAEHGAPDADRARALALSTALVSRARRDGHSAVALGEHAGLPFPEDEHAPASAGRGGRGLPILPALDAWRAHLEASPAVGAAAGGAAPLVLDRDRLALRRFVDAERRTAAAVLARVGPALAAPPAAAAEAFGALFPPRADGALDRQALAAAAALRQRVLLVAGGPGTGKTYTATRILALLRAAQPDLRVALAAPTGKAAARLSESLAGGVADLGERGAGLPTEAVTLHRLLGAHPERAGFRHDARAPLPHDLVLVDEGSMVDLPLFDALLAALRPEARLVVLGDPDQLPPVEVGSTFADLCAAGTGPAPPGLDAFCGALGLGGVEADPDAAPLAASVVALTESRRFTADSDVGVFAVAVRDGDAGGAVAALRDRPALDLVEDDPAGAAVAWAGRFAPDVVTAETPEAALEALGRFRLLAAVRRGPRGVEGLNETVERALRQAGHVRWSPYGDRLYPGRPLLVTQNDRTTGLANGDVGVLWRVENRDVVVFPDREPIAFERLPAHEPAWALTVHKSQGSEFDAVGVVLPEPGTRGAAFVSRRLLYTAATRARGGVVVFGDADAVERAVATDAPRASGLAERLGGAAD